MNPWASRCPCQQSSMLTYWYPASFMPEATIASAVSRISCSFTLSANLFQLFQPICGVKASWSNFWPCALTQATQAMINRIRFMVGRWFILRLFRLHGFFEISARAGRRKIPVLDQAGPPMRIKTPDGVGDSVLGAIGRDGVAITFISGNRIVTAGRFRLQKADLSKNDRIFFGDKSPIVRPVRFPGLFGLHGIRMGDITDAFGVERCIGNRCQVIAKIKTGDERDRCAAAGADGLDEFLHKPFPFRPGAGSEFQLGIDRRLIE